MYHLEDTIEPLNAAFVELIDRHIPSRVTTFRNKDKAWFNDNCRRAFLEKQEAFNLWRRNKSDFTWNNYVRLRSDAIEVYKVAEREYNRGVKETLENAVQSHKWWGTLKSALFGIDDGMPPLLKPNGSLAYSPE